MSTDQPRAADGRVRVGQVYAGVSGNRMVVLAVEGDQCQLAYQPNPGGEDPIWEDSYDVSEYLTLVRDA